MPRPDPNSNIQILPVVTDRHLVKVVDMDRPGLTNLHVPVSLVLTGDGAPVDFAAAVAATLVVDSLAANADLTFTAVVAGAAGNAFTVAIVQPVEVDQELGVEFDGTDAVISLPTDSLGDPVAATATEVKAAWDASDAVGAISVVVQGTGAGEVDTATVANLASGEDEVAGTGVGSPPGYLYSDYTTPGLYINTGTAEEPEWTAV